MKRILLSLVVLVLAGSVAVGATRAYFSDTEAINNNTFAAGKLDLELGQTTTLPFDVPNVVPGQSGEGKVRLTNVAGSIPGKLNVTLSNLVQLENDVTEPEQGLNGENDIGPGELDKFLKFTVFVDVNKDGTFNAGDIQLRYGGLVQPNPPQDYLNASYINSMLASWNDIMTMTDGQSVDLIVRWQFPTASEDANYSQNIAMTDSLKFDLGFVLNQVP